MGFLEQSGRAGRSNGSSPDHGIEELQRFAAIILKKRGRGGHRGRFPAVQRRELAFFSVVPNKKSPAAQARGLGLDKPEHRLNGDHGIGGGAACLEHPGPRLDGKGVGGRDHPVRGRDRLAACLCCQGSRGFRREGFEGRGLAVGTFRSHAVGCLLRCCGTRYGKPQADCDQRSA